jgi:hypothetical protein
MFLPTATSPEAQLVPTDVYRRMSGEQKWQLLASAWRTAKQLHAAEVLAADPSATAEAIHESWLTVTLGPALVEVLREAGHLSKSRSLEPEIRPDWVVMEAASRRPSEG